MSMSATNQTLPNQTYPTLSPHLHRTLCGPSPTTVGDGKALIRLWYGVDSDLIRRWS